MRKVFKIVIIFVVLLLTLTSCGIFHHHQYVEKTVDPTCVSEGKIYLECSCGKIINEENIEKIDHIFDEGTIAKEATCQEEGLKIFVCTICNYSKGEKLSKTEHIGVYIPSVSASCTETGTRGGYKCKWCSEKLSGFETLPILEHYYINGVCKNCGETTYSDGFIYDLNANNRTYTIVSVGTCEDENIIIPAYHNGLPVTSIGERAFYGCSFIKTVTFEEGLYNLSIGIEAFRSCSELMEVKNAEIINSLAKEAFLGCRKLQSFNLGENFHSFGPGVFNSCSNLKLSLNEKNPYFKLVNGILYSKDMKTLYQYLPSNNAQTCVIPSEVEIIYPCAFFSLSFERILFEENSQVKKIGSNAFLYCTLNEIDLSTLENLKEIEYAAFFGVSGLKELILPDGLETIQSAALGCMNLEKLVIPNSVNNMSHNIFQVKPKNLTIYCEISTKPTNWSNDWNDSSSQVIWGYKG